MTSGVSRPIEIPLGNGRRARSVRVTRTAPAGAVVAGLGLGPARGLVVLNGGTADLGPELAEALRQVIGGELARVAADERLTLLTGGTQAGIFALLGEGLAAGGRTAPCIGVVPSGRVTWPGRPADDPDLADDHQRVPLEPHHSHFVLVEGSAWGDETAMLSAVTDELSRTAPAIVVLASGGSVARDEVDHHLRQGREVVVVAGSGRLADDLAAALDGDRHDDPTVTGSVSGRLLSFDLAGGGLDDLIRRRLGLRPGPGRRRGDH